MEKYYDIVLLEKPGNAGLIKTDVIDLMDMLNSLEGFPLEIGDINGNSSAMGFITPQAAEKLSYVYDQESALGQYIASILDDVNKESEDCTYTFNGLRIWMSRE